MRPEEGYGSTILRLARERARGSKPQAPGACEPTRWELLESVTAPLVFQAAAEGGRLAQEVIEEACFYGGVALANVANAYDPKIITVGGALALEHPEILEPLREEMLRYLNVAPPEVLLTPLGEDAVLFGALALAKEAAEDSG